MIDMASAVWGGVGVLSANVILLRLLWIRLDKMEEKKVCVSMCDERGKQTEIKFEDLERQLHKCHLDNKDEHLALSKCLQGMKGDQKDILQAIHTLDLKVAGG